MKFIASIFEEPQENTPQIRGKLTFISEPQKPGAERTCFFNSFEQMKQQVEEEYTKQRRSFKA